jgi:segregation and condensation protein B
MEDSPRTDEQVPEPAEDLSRAYKALLEQKSWSIDLPGRVADPAERPENGDSPPLDLLRILEALVFVGGKPVTLERATAAVRGLTAEQLEEAMAALNRAYRRQGRPYMIQLQQGGYVMVLRPRFRAAVERLQGPARDARLSAAAIDVLALVAYRQPVSKLEIDGIRGIESGSLLRQLVRRGLISIVQRGQAGQREVFYGTTARFLELFKLRGLEDLPQTQDLQKL